MAVSPQAVWQCLHTQCGSVSTGRVAVPPHTLWQCLHTQCGSVSTARVAVSPQAVWQCLHRPRGSVSTGRVAASPQAVWQRLHTPCGSVSTGRVAVPPHTVWQCLHRLCSSLHTQRGYTWTCTHFLYVPSCTFESAVQSLLSLRQHLVATHTVRAISGPSSQSSQFTIPTVYVIPLSPLTVYNLFY